MESAKLVGVFTLIFGLSFLIFSVPAAEAIGLGMSTVVRTDEPVIPDPSGICGAGSGACVNGDSCCSDAIGQCDVTSAPYVDGDCYDCDTSLSACSKCCASSGTSGDECVSGEYRTYTWVWGANKCCGDDGSSDDFSSDSSSAGCCCNGNQIGTGNDVSCSGYNNEWCIDGTYCSGLVRDSSLSATDTIYVLSGDDIICGCDSSGDKCDDTDSDGTADGLCASGTCDTNLVAKSGSTYYSACASGRECDTDVTPTSITPRYVKNGFCAQSNCCTALMDSGETSGQTEDWSDGDEDCMCTNNHICDNSVTAGSPNANGVCAGTVCDTNTAACSNTNPTCSGGTLYTSCSIDGYGCESGTIGGNGYNKEGLCCSNSCIVDGSRSSGQACCNDDNCGSGLTCNNGKCGGLSTQPMTLSFFNFPSIGSLLQNPLSLFFF
ncbi:MAG: hypothetical protein ABIH52_00320 [Candidatus Aenigmatarchaeota archaeon]|nr:hypothetical protein [Nanoarchaeota archaeon]